MCTPTQSHDVRQWWPIWRHLYRPLWSPRFQSPEFRHFRRTFQTFCLAVPENGSATARPLTLVWEGALDRDHCQSLDTARKERFVG